MKLQKRYESAMIRKILFFCLAKSIETFRQKIDSIYESVYNPVVKLIETFQQPILLEVQYM
jgi:hypothetical protein